MNSNTPLVDRWPFGVPPWRERGQADGGEELSGASGALNPDRRNWFCRMQPNFQHGEIGKHTDPSGRVIRVRFPVLDPTVNWVLTDKPPTIPERGRVLRFKAAKRNFELPDYPMLEHPHTTARAIMVGHLARGGLQEQLTSECENSD